MSNKTNPEIATNTPDKHSSSSELLSDPKELARVFTETFADYHLTPTRKLAADIMIDMPMDISESDRRKFINERISSSGVITDTEHRNVVIGILEDYRVVQELFDRYIETIDRSTLAGKTLRLPGDQQVDTNVWSDETPIPPPNIDDLIKTFSTKGEGSQGIGLETAMIVGAMTLARLKTAPYSSATAYKFSVFAKNFLVPICSIIGLDNLESDLNDEVDIIAGRNIGDNMNGGRLSSNIDAIMNETDRIVSLHFGRKDSSDPKRFEFAIQNLNGIMRALLGNSNLMPAVKTESPHSTLFMVGKVATQKGELEIRARGKGRGSYFRKLLRNIGYYGSHIEPLNDEGELHPIDLYGATVIAENNDQLASAYVEAVVNALENQKITPYPSPNRKEMFVIKGSLDFQQQVREAVIARIPGIDMRMFSFSESKSGFTDAKITGFYETGDGRIPFAPFEVQFSTPDARQVARIDKKAAHFFFKLQKTYGDLVGMSDDVADGIRDIWQRKQDYFSNYSELDAAEAHLTNQSRERVECFEKQLQEQQLASRQMAAAAMRDV